MTAAVQICLTWFCIFIYAPVFMRAVQQIRSGEVILHGQGLQWRTARRYTGASVWAYGLGQALSAIIMISGTISAFLRDDFLFFVLTIAVAWLVGQSGLWLADQLGYEELANPQAEAIDFLNRVVSTIRVNVNRPEPGPGERQLNEADDGMEDAEYRFVKPSDDEDLPSEPD
jgi:hypothetical protein